MSEKKNRSSSFIGLSSSPTAQLLEWLRALEYSLGCNTEDVIQC